MSSLYFAKFISWHEGTFHFYPITATLHRAVTMGFIIKNQPAQLARPPKGSFFMATSTYPRVTWYKNARLRRLYFYCVILILTNVANGFDGSMMNGLQSLPFWQNFFHHPHSSILGFFNSAMSLGSLVGLPLIPPMIDRLGRKFGVIFGSVIVIIGGALQAASINFGMFVGARMMLGFGMVIATAAAPLLVAEIAHPQDRALLCTFMGVSYGIGSFIASWVTFGTLKLQSNWAWRLPSLLQVMCSILVLCLIWFIPESPRWYISKDKPEKALEILAYYHADGDEKDEVVQLEFTEICTSFALDKEAHTSSRYVDFLKTEGNRRRIGIITALALFSQWSGNGLVSYYLSIIMRSVGITNPTDQLGINAGLQTFGLVVAFAFSFLIDSLGRRKLYIWGTIGTLLTFVVWTIFSARYTIQGDDPGLGKGVVVMIFFYNFFYNLK